MNKQIEALKMAIEALSQDEGWFEPEAAIKACKEALARQAQEPVAWMSEGGIFTRTKEHAEIWSNNGGKVTPVYTHPAPSWQGLSDDDMSIIFDKFDWKEVEIAGEYLDLFKFARAIEAALKEKNER